VNPRTNTEAWVVNQVSNSVSVVTPVGGSLLPDFRIESLQTRRRRFDLHGAVQSKSPELAFSDPPYPGLRAKVEELSKRR